MTSYQRQLERINRNLPLADEWVSELHRYLCKQGHPCLMDEHTGYAFAAFAQGMDPESCDDRMVLLDHHTTRMVVEAF